MPSLSAQGYAAEGQSLEGIATLTPKMAKGNTWIDPKLVFPEVEDTPNIPQ